MYLATNITSTDDLRHAARVNLGQARPGLLRRGLAHVPDGVDTDQVLAWSAAVLRANDATVLALGEAIAGVVDHRAVLNRAALAARRAPQAHLTHCLAQAELALSRVQAREANLTRLAELV